MHRWMLLVRATMATLAGAAVLAAGGPGGTAAATASPCGHVRRAPAWNHIIVISFENHSYRDILGPSAPKSYFKTLAGECGSAADFTAAHFPHSLGNYLAATGGRVVTPADCTPGPECSSGAANIFSQVGGAHWRTFAESMPAPCDRSNTSLYVPRHAPAIYYTRIPRAVCRADMLPMPAHAMQFKRTFTWIAPNLRHDMHDGTPAQASRWLQAFLGGPGGVLHRRPYTRGHTAIFIWFDSAGGAGSLSTPLPFIVISPSTPHTLARRALDHYGALRGWEGMLGLPCVGNACDVRGIRLPFNL